MKQFIYFSKYKSEANISKSFNLRMCRRSSYVILYYFRDKTLGQLSLTLNFLVLIFGTRRVLGGFQNFRMPTLFLWLDPTITKLTAPCPSSFSRIKDL